MLKQLQKRNQSGFTIIEVMIVLAIAGVIMMLVFLAIPALQRNNRNTQYRNDVANILGYISEYTSNNNGALPGSVSVETNGDVLMCTSGSCSAADDKVGTIRGGTEAEIRDASGTTFPTTADTERIVLLQGAQCDGNDIDDSAGSRSVAAAFQIETANGTENQCQAN